ncbi:hypothetical protein HGM15179_016197 [Zosterops borbonicus]|uniref:Uncharacterized protein n=1 Tax=Zosterops borbonicus TaxID=364589 RepID=A0A8K1G362_9PASS|nr:hypothetical protein HGM15179_016197 [Zosterops borbonicus]
MGTSERDRLEKSKKKPKEFYGHYSAIYPPSCQADTKFHVLFTTHAILDPDMSYVNLSNLYQDQVIFTQNCKNLVFMTRLGGDSDQSGLAGDVLAYGKELELNDL